MISILLKQGLLNPEIPVDWVLIFSKTWPNSHKSAILTWDKAWKIQHLLSSHSAQHDQTNLVFLLLRYVFEAIQKFSIRLSFSLLLIIFQQFERATRHESNMNKLAQLYLLFALQRPIICHRSIFRQSLAVSTDFPELLFSPRISNTSNFFFFPFKGEGGLFFPFFKFLRGGGAPSGIGWFCLLRWAWQSGFRKRRKNLFFTAWSVGFLIFHWLFFIDYFLLVWDKTKIWRYSLRY